MNQPINLTFHFFFFYNMQSLLIYLELFIGQNQEITILSIIYSSEFLPEFNKSQLLLTDIYFSNRRKHAFSLHTTLP